MAEVDALDREEDRRFGGCRGDELPEHLSTAEKRRKAIRRVTAELEAEAREPGGGIQALQPRGVSA